MYNKAEILNKLKFYCKIVGSVTFLIFVFKYSQLIGLTKINHVRIIGNDFIHESIIKEVIEIIPNSDILFFNVADTQEKINGIDYIKSCRVSRIFPSTLIVEIIENVPLAYVKTYEDEFIIDKDGNSLPISEKVINYFEMPKLNYNKDLFQSENKNYSITKGIGTELNYLKNKFPHIYNGISIIDYTNRGDVRMEFAKNTEIFVKEDKLNLHFKILNKFKELNEDLTDYSIIDLRVNNQLIVKENKLKKS